MLKYVFNMLVVEGMFICSKCFELVFEPEIVVILVKILKCFSICIRLVLLQYDKHILKIKKIMDKGKVSVYPYYQYNQHIQNLFSNCLDI